MIRAQLVALLVLLTVPTAPARAITLEQAMADPDWIGPPVEAPYWSADGHALYYRLKEKGSSVRDLHRIDLTNGTDAIVDPAAMANADGSAMVFDRDRRRTAFVRNGDIFIRDLGSGRLTQVTRTPQAESEPQFSADGRAVQYRAGNDWYSYDIAAGVGGPAAIVKTENDPVAKKPDDLEALQLKLFSTLREIKAEHVAERQHFETYTKGDATRVPLPFYLGDDVQIADSSLSPDGHWLLEVTTPKGYNAGRIGKLQRFVTESGYEEQEDERTRVGRNDPPPQTLWLLDLQQHEIRKLGFADLPGIHDDPLKAIRDENAALVSAGHGNGDIASKRTDGQTKKETGEPRERPLEVNGFAWTRDGTQVAAELRAIDNKDRWIASVNFGTGQLIVQHRLTDSAWINWNFNDFGWERDDHTLWYLSEETGWSQLYAKRPGGKAIALTRGEFEVSHPTLSADGRWFYVRANVEAPYSYDVYRVAVGGGTLTRITRIQGMERFALSPDDTQLALLHSEPYLPPQLAATAADGSGSLRELTDTRTPEYKALQWPALDIVAVPSTHTRQPIFAKLYTPVNFDRSRKYPAVLFVHGAGYTQDVDYYWSYYFREQMFHNLLNEQGYVVLDLDYRASEGYGRAWRTAIYRDMGHPELEDLIDGVHWLEKNRSVDPARVGVYGGSYGGFMTLMAMFRAPDVFAAGAALRPVTDWTQYNHEYTSNILNDPQIDPLAYQRSSPIEFADGLKGPLLICHGMIDNNVLFEDTVRLYQRLIELHKENFELAPFPMERHGFVHADSWLDEYKRIYALFQRTIGRSNGH